MKYLHHISIVMIGSSLGVAWSPEADSTRAAPLLPASRMAVASTVQENRCVALQGRRFADAHVVKAEILVAGGAGPAARQDVCRVRARLIPVPGSKIEMDVWLPANWNGKMLGLGGGGFNGGLFSAARKGLDPVNRGYAVLATDAGHDFEIRATWALNRPERIVDFGHRANRLGALAAKSIIASHYGTHVRRAYFQGCSNGGRDALMLAQRSPGVYDGIIAGAPANDWTGLFAIFMRNEQVTRLSPGVDSLGPKLGLVREAVMKHCDAMDGVRDRLISNPAICRFDPAVLACKPGQPSTCLAPAETAAVRTIYRGTYLKSGAQVMPGFPPGSEYEWPAWFTSPAGGGAALGPDFYRFMVFNDPEWSVSRFQLDRDLAVSRQRVGATLDATDPDLRRFIRRGGRLLMYHGWDDAAIPAGNSIRYFDATRRMLGRSANRVQLFMVPGLAHCSGGVGPNRFDALGALDKWAERGVTPDRIIASTEGGAEPQPVAGKIRTRPICAWPKTPYYRGNGAMDDERSFVCR